VGEWQTPESSSYYGESYQPNRMTVGSDGTGRAEIAYVLTADPSVRRDRFEIEWQEQGEATFELTMDCFDAGQGESGAEAHDFTMICEAEGGGQGEQTSTLSCSGDGAWTDYDFAWEAVLED
jgi:hypothetical protein